MYLSEKFGCFVFMCTVNERNATRLRHLVREPWWAHTVDREVKANRMSGDKGEKQQAI